MGGAIYSVGTVILDIYDSQFLSNSAQIGGALHLSQETRLLAQHCRFENNQASEIASVLNLVISSSVG